MKRLLILMRKNSLQKVLLKTMGKILFCVILLCFCACGKVEHDELWGESIELPNGSHCYVYHSFNCPRKKPLFPYVEKKCYFRKMKYDVFDCCISEEDIQILNLVSNKNIRETIMFVPEISYEMKKYGDLSDRGYMLYYSANESGLIELEEPMSGYSLLRLYGN